MPATGEQSSGNVIADAIMIGNERLVVSSQTLKHDAAGTSDYQAHSSENLPTGPKPGCLVKEGHDGLGALQRVDDGFVSASLSNIEMPRVTPLPEGQPVSISEDGCRKEECIAGQGSSLLIGDQVPSKANFRSKSKEPSSKGGHANKRTKSGSTSCPPPHRSVSPVISKSRNSQGIQPVLQNRLQTQIRHQNSEGTFVERKPFKIDVSKPVNVPVPQDVDMSPREKEVHCVDDDIVEAFKQITKQQEHEEKIMKCNIDDAVHKWCGQLPRTHQTRIDLLL